MLQEHRKASQAVKYYQMALHQNPNEIKALLCVGNAKYEEGSYEQAAQLFERALKQNEKLPDVEYNLANSYFHTGQVTEAITHYQKAIELIHPI